MEVEWRRRWSGVGGKVEVEWRWTGLALHTPAPGPPLQVLQPLLALRLEPHLDQGAGQTSFYYLGFEKSLIISPMGQTDTIVTQKIKVIQTDPR